MNAIRELIRRCNVVAFLIFITALVVYYFQSLGWPLSPGRDFGSYISYYLQTFSAEPANSLIMLHRTALVPLILGTLADVGGVALLHVFAALMYGGAVLCVYLIGAAYNRTCGVLSALLVLMFPHYAVIFHFISSEFLASVVFLIWVLFVVRSNRSETIRKYFYHAIFVVTLILIRPSNQVFILFGFFALVDVSLGFKEKFQSIVVFFLTVIALSSVYSFYNYVRYDQFCIKGEASKLGFVKVFTHMGIVSPDNGPKSKMLSQLVETYLLETPPYKSSNITLDSFFASPNARKRFDLSCMVKRHIDDKSFLRDVTREAITAHFGIFAKICIRDLLGIFLNNPVRPEAPFEVRDNKRQTDTEKLTEQFLVRSSELSEGQDIGISFCELEIYLDQDSVRKIAQLNEKINALNLNLPQQQGHVVISRALNLMTDYFPKIFWFITLGFFAFFYWRRWEAIPLLYLVCLALANVVLSVLLINSVPHYRIIFDPVFIVFAVIALFPHRQTQM